MRHKEQTRLLNSLRSTLKLLNENPSLDRIRSATTVKNLLRAEIAFLELELRMDPPTVLIPVAMPDDSAISDPMACN